jgi:DNA-directed RNA polymerase subunit RPC12/RpoP
LWKPSKCAALARYFPPSPCRPHLWSAGTGRPGEPGIVERRHRRTSVCRRDICLTDGLLLPTMVVVAGLLPAATPLVEHERRRNVCPASKPCSGRSQDLSFPRSFVCAHCGVDVSLDAPGTSHRNHCPRCLWSRHLDRNVPGDRKADCPGGMEPISVTVRGERRWMLIHRCTRCGRLRMNRTAADDNMLLLMQLAALPLATPPLPYLSHVTPPGHGSGTAERRT